MDIERNSRNSRFSNPRLANQSSSYRSSLVSIDRFSQRRPSLSKKISLINAMDIERSNHSNYRAQDDLLMDQSIKRFSDYRRSSNKERQPYSFQPNIEEKDLNRKSNFKINHQCSCQNQECLSNHCSCFLTPRQICVIGQCCPNCILLKNQYLQSTRGFQLQREKKQKEEQEEEHTILNLIKQKNCKNMHYFKQVYANDPCMKDLIFCTCKKSHCQKKYCLCYEKGIKCGQFCICIECENKQNEEDEYKQQQQRRWQRYATYNPYDQNEQKGKIDPDIEQYLDNQMEDEGQFNQTMQFQPVNFDNVLSNMYM